MGIISLTVDADGNNANNHQMILSYLQKAIGRGCAHWQEKLKEFKTTTDQTLPKLVAYLKARELRTSTSSSSTAGRGTKRQAELQIESDGGAKLLRLQANGGGNKSKHVPKQKAMINILRGRGFTVSSAKNHDTKNRQGGRNSNSRPQQNGGDKVLACQNCNSPMHLSKNCPVGYCGWCKRPGHISFNCIHRKNGRHRSSWSATPAVNPSSQPVTPSTEVQSR
jgi:hypothetical protein